MKKPTGETGKPGNLFKPKTRLRATRHIADPAPYLCGCPDCLKRDGLEIVEVWDENRFSWRTMLVNWFNKDQLSDKKYRRAENRTQPDSRSV